MSLFILSMALTVAANVIYHLCQKGISPSANPITSLAATYACALVFTLACFPFFYPLSEFPASLRTLNGASYVLSLGVVGLEFGFLLAYRAGWNLSQAALYANVAVTLLLIPVGLFVFRESLSARNVLGIFLALLGLALMKR